MLSFKEQYDRLSEVYSVSCPKCGARWSFKITSQNKWIQIRTCGCPECEALIEKRLDDSLLKLKDGDK